MFFYIPVKVYCEDECVRAHADELAALGKKALLVTGKSSAFKNGAIADIEAALSAHGKGWTIFNEVEENPSVETVLKGRDRGLAEGADFVIGVGGGSPMDAAKAIALLLGHEGAGAEYLYDSSADSSAVPLVCIPTTCGTGSETTANAVLTRRELHTKGAIPHRLFASLALLDGKYLQHAPRRVICDTAVDALSHLYESFLNVRTTDLSRMCVDAGLRIWSRNREALLSGAPLELKSCNEMLLASALAGMAVAHAATTIPHALSYTLTVETGMPHGKACGYFLSAFLREADPADAAWLLQTSGFEDIDDFEAFYRAVSGQEEVSADILEQAVAAALANPAKLADAPFLADEAVLRRIAGLKA